MKTLTLQDLFIRPQPVEITKGGGNITLWIRTLTQVEKELCNAAARTAARMMRRILEDETSDERATLIIGELEGYDDDAIKELWVGDRLLAKAVQISRESLENRDQTFIPEPEGVDVTSEQIERYENEVEDIEALRESGVSKAVTAAKAALESEASEIPIDELRIQAAPMLINTICTQAWSREFASQMIARATFLDKDARKPAFKTVEEVRMLEPDVLQILADSHYGLLVEPEALKRSGGEQKSST